MRSNKVVDIKQIGNGATPTTSPVAVDAAAFADGPEIPAVTTPYADIERALGLEDEGVTVKEVLVTVACRKPRATEFFMVHPDDAMSRACYVVIDREVIGGETFFVMPEARPYVFEHLRPVLLTVCVNRQATPFLWPISLADPNVGNGRTSSWTASALQGRDAGRKGWVKLVAGSGNYRVFAAENPDLPAPQWPEQDFLELVAIAFRDATIKDGDHPYVRRVRGLI
jgi:hypothetical protein